MSHNCTMLTGQPWRNPSAERPTLGGAGLPFPRRLASYRPNWEKTDFESKVEDPNALLKVFVVSNFPSGRRDPAASQECIVQGLIEPQGDTHVM